MTISAYSGSTIDLSKLTAKSVSPYRVSLAFTSSGVGSLIDVSSLTDFTNVTFSTSSSGRIITGNMAEIVNQTLNITAANFDEFDFSAITTIRNSTINVSGVTVDFSNVTVLEQVALSASNGGKINFPTVTTYPGSSSRSWDASGVGSEINMPALTTLQYTVTGTPSYFVTANASSGGKIDLSKLTTGTSWLNVSSQYTSSGTASLIDISCITELNVYSLYTGSGGTVKVSDSVTRLNNVTANINTLLGFDANRIVSIRNSSLTVSGPALRLTECTD